MLTQSPESTKKEEAGDGVFLKLKTQRTNIRWESWNKRRYIKNEAEKEAGACQGPCAQADTVQSLESLERCRSGPVLDFDPRSQSPIIFEPGPKRTGYTNKVQPCMTLHLG